MKQGQMSQLGFIVLLLVGVVGFVLFVLPLKATVAELSLSKAESASVLEGLQSDYESLEQLSQEVSNSEATKEALVNAVPVGPAQDDLILELSEMATDASFDLNAMSFTDSIDQTYGNTLTISVNLTGSYDDLVDFLQKVEGAERLMTVKSLSVQLTTTTDVVFNLSIEAYYQ